MDLYSNALRHALFPAWERLRGRPTVALIAGLERLQYASADELHAMRCGLVRRLARHAYRHTAFYRARFDAAGLAPDDVRTVDDLRKLPLLERDDARTAGAARETDAPPFVAVRKSTSGSTGRPIEIAYNAESRHWRDATRWRGYGWAGYRVGDRALHYWGVAPSSTSSWAGRAKLALDHVLRRDRYVDCTPRSDAHLRAVVDELRRFRPGAILAYSQAAAILARFVTREGLRDWGTIPVICGAEAVWPHDRDAIAAAFGPAVFETYGSREFMLMGSECEVHDGLHESMETLIVEIVVREPGGTTRPARPGEQGEVVITDLHNLANPFIRYVNGDLAIARAPSPCACGRTLDRFGPVEGRVAETLHDGAGHPVNGLVFNILFTVIHEYARQFQVVQRAGGDVTLRVVPTGDGLPREAERLARDHAARYLPGVRFDVELVEDIPTTAAGKRQIIVVERSAA
jgi:phenylacetate-CoA ligase